MAVPVSCVSVVLMIRRVRLADCPGKWCATEIGHDIRHDRLLEAVEPRAPVSIRTHMRNGFEWNGDEKRRNYEQLLSFCLDEPKGFPCKCRPE